MLWDSICCVCGEKIAKLCSTTVSTGGQMGSAAIPIDLMIARLELLAEVKKEPSRRLLLSSEIRGAKCMEQQIDAMSKELDWVSIALLVGLPKTTVYRKWKRFILPVLTAEVQDSASRPGGNFVLSNEQENSLIEWIRQRQLAFDCPTPGMVRQQAAVLKYGDLVDGQKLSRMWWNRFKNRHIDVLGTVIASSLETGRTRVTVEQVFEYASLLLRALTVIKSPKQILNMDETGFHSRIDKGRRRKCVYIRGLQTRPTFHEEGQSTTVSLVATISMSGDALRPLFLTKERVRCESTTLKLLRDRLLTFQTPKGYQNEDSMIFYLRMVITPYVQTIRNELREPNAKGLFDYGQLCQSFDTKD